MLIPHFAPRGYSTLSSAAAIAGISAVKAGRFLDARGLREIPDGFCSPVPTSAALESGTAEYMPYGSPVRQTAWHTERLAAMLCGAIDGDFTAIPKPPRPKPVARISIYGETYPVREELKALGGRWDRRAGSWRVPVDRAEEARKIIAAGGAQ